MNHNHRKYNIFGTSWTEVNGIAYLLENIHKYIGVTTYSSLQDFLEYTKNESNQWIFLSVKPNECAYFLYQMACRYPDAKIVVLADKFYLSDMVVLDELKFVGVVFDELIQCKSIHAFNVPYCKLPMDTNFDRDSFITYINERITISLHKAGISFSEQEVMTMFAQGYSSESICKLMRVNKKTVSAHKINGLKKLHCRKDRYAIIKNLQVNCNMPKLPIINEDT